MPFKMEQLISLGILMIFIGFAIVIIGTFLSASGPKEAGSGAKAAVGGFIGPIPFGFGNDKNLVWFVTILSAALLLFWLFASFRIPK